jgi:ABC-2 type transport system ATP-binding protein
LARNPHHDSVASRVIFWTQLNTRISGMETVIAAHRLSKSYGGRNVVDELELEVRAGEVFGFLGPNGAGKTTTIRMLLGLVHPTSGVVEVLGRDVLNHGGRVLSQVGALIESPALYGYLSGRENLICFAEVLGGVPSYRLEKVLDLVGLTASQHQLVKTYSLGMKQRLSLAVALVNDPQLLVLDEPSNALDPAGVVEIRDLLKGLAKEGKTVFLSSHVLAEVEACCDRVVILSHGKVVANSQVAALTAGEGLFEVRVERADTAVGLFRTFDWGRDARVEQGLLVTQSPTGRGRDLVEMLNSTGFRVDAISERRPSLEQIFLRLTQEASN